MKIETKGFSPLLVYADGVETPVLETNYLDKDGKSQVISYVVVNGTKYAIQCRVELLEKLDVKSVDDTLIAVEIERLDKIENDKDKEVKP